MFSFSTSRASKVHRQLAGAASEVLLGAAGSEPAATKEAGVNNALSTYTSSVSTALGCALHGDSQPRLPGCDVVATVRVHAGPPPGVQHLFSELILSLAVAPTNRIGRRGPGSAPGGHRDSFGAQRKQ